MAQSFVNLKEARADDYFSIEEAATYLKLEKGSIRNLLYHHKLTHYKFKTATLISKVEAREYKKQM